MCGIGTYTNYLANALLDIDDGSSVTVLARKGGEERNSGRLTVIPSFSAGDYTDVLFNLRHLRPDIIHIQHEFGLFPAEENFLKFLKAVKADGYPLILTLHTVNATHTVNMPGINVDIEEYNRKIGDLVDCEIVHLDRPLRRVLLRMGIAKEKLEIIPHGTKLFASIDSYQAKERLGLPAGKLILSFGFISRGKNQLSLIEALPLILRDVSDAYLFIAGYSRVMDPDDLFYIKHGQGN